MSAAKSLAAASHDDGNGGVSTVGPSQSRPVRPGLDSGNTGTSAPPAVFREKKAGPEKIGNVRARDRRKFNFEDLGTGGAAGIVSSKADRMTADQAWVKTAGLFEIFIAGEPAEHKAAFLEAMFFCHTVNSGSVAQPGRATFAFVVNGRESKEFKMSDVIMSLREDTRRYFRAYADEIRDVNQKILDACNPLDPVSNEKAAWILQVAAERGLSRYPNLAHDSSSACTMLTLPERSAVAQSSRRVLSHAVNVPDGVRTDSRVEYDVATRSGSAVGNEY